MMIITMFVGAILTVVGALAAAILLNWLLWHAAALVGHPAWGPPLVAIPVILAVTGRLPANGLIGLTLGFAAVIAIPLWVEGRKPPADRPGRVTSTPTTNVVPLASARSAVVPASSRYPAIAACIQDSRRASPQDIKKVAARVWRESFTGSPADTSFAARRSCVRAARLALEGDRSSDGDRSTVSPIRQVVSAHRGG